MFKILLVIFFVSNSLQTFSQASDFISVKKHNRSVKTFFPGLPISFETFDKRQVGGRIESIRNDSIFIREWDVRQMINSLGIPMIDTVASYLDGFNYKEIATIDVSDRMRLSQVTPGRILIIGGIGYILLNVINGAYLHESVTSSKNLTSLGIAAGAIGVGLLSNYIARHAHKYHIEYIHMNEVKKQLRGF